MVFTAFAYPPPAVSSGPHANHGTGQVPGVLVRLGLDDLRMQARAGTDVNPGDVKLTPDGRRVLVTHFDLTLAMRPGRARAARTTRRSSLRHLRRRHPGPRLGAVRVGMAAHGLTTSADGRTAFVACYGSDELAVVALDDPDLPGDPRPGGPQPGQRLADPVRPLRRRCCRPTAASVYVSNLESGDVRVFDVAQRAFDPGRVALVRGGRLLPRPRPRTAPA